MEGGDPPGWIQEAWEQAGLSGEQVGAEGERGVAQGGGGDGTGALKAEAGEGESGDGVEQAKRAFPGMRRVAEDFAFDEVIDSVVFDEAAGGFVAGGDTADDLQAAGFEEGVAEGARQHAGLIAMNGQDRDARGCGVWMGGQLETYGEPAFADQTDMGRAAFGGVVRGQAGAHAAFELAHADIEARIEIGGFAKGFDTDGVFAGLGVVAGNGAFAQPGYELAETTGAGEGLALQNPEKFAALRGSGIRGQLGAQVSSFREVCAM